MPWSVVRWYWAQCKFCEISNAFASWYARRCWLNSHIARNGPAHRCSTWEVQREEW
jgi:hypothetical protein